MCFLSLGGMQKPQGKRLATEAFSETRELEKKPAVEYPKSPLELLPREVQYEIVKALTKARGATKRARLDNAAENIRSFFRTNRLFKSFEYDQNLINYIIAELANNYADGDKIAAAIALGTESAGTWLTLYLAGPNVTREIALPRMNIFYENFLEAVRNARFNVLDFLLSLYNDAWQSFIMQGLLEATVKGKANVINKILSHNNIKPIKNLLVNKTNEAQETLLFSAVRVNKPQVVDIFIAAGANVNHANDFHQTPLQFAAAGPYPIIVEKLLNAHADTNIADDNGLTALMLAVEHGSVDAVNLLIHAGANVNHVDNEGHSVLWHAHQYTEKNKDAIIKILTDNGAI